ASCSRWGQATALRRALPPPPRSPSCLCHRPRRSWCPARCQARQLTWAPDWLLGRTVGCCLMPFERALFAAGRAPHVIAHIDHHVADAFALAIDVAKQRRREGAVAAGAIKSDLSRLGRVDDHHAGRCLDTGEPAADIERATEPERRGGR